jgi:hydrogenase maturation protease
VALLRSTHAFGLAEAVELARALGRLPRFLVVYGVEGKCFTPGAALSAGVEAAAADAAARVLDEVGSLLRATPPPAA